MANINLTQNEIALLKLLVNSLDGDRQDQKDDNFSPNDLSDYTVAMNMSAAQVKGVGMSLFNKRLAYPVDSDSAYNMYYQLTDLGIDTIFDHIEGK